MATQCANSNKREFSKPHLTTSPMLIDVQGRVAKIYERRDIKKSHRDMEFLCYSFAFCLWAYSLGGIAVGLAYGLISAMLNGSTLVSLPAFSLSDLIAKAAYMAVTIAMGVISGAVILLPVFGGTALMYIRRDFWAPELAKQTTKVSLVATGEFKTTLDKISDTTQKIFIGRFLKLRWNVTGEHSKTLQTIDVKPVFMMNKKAFNKKEKRRLAYWVATLKYSALPKNGKTELTWC